MLADYRNRGLGWYLNIPVMAARKGRQYYELIRAHEGYAHPHRSHPSRSDPFFLELHGASAGHAVMGKSELYNLYQFARQVRHLPGDVAEVGVYRGGTAKLLAGVFGDQDKEIHLFDTFAGMPAVDVREDLHQAGDFDDTSLEGVRRYLQGHPNVRLHPGFFPETAGPVQDRTFRFVHLDADIYQSTKDGCEFFYPRMDRGGIMVFHDYEIPSCPGVRKAVDEFFADKPEQVLYLPTNQCFIVKA